MQESAKRATIERYFQGLDDGDFERAAEQFTEDVTYVHPPSYGTETHISGRDSLFRYFTETRGEQPIDHHVERAVSGEDACAVVGYVTDSGGSEPVEYFVAFAEFEGGKVDYYVAGLLGLS